MQEDFWEQRRSETEYCTLHEVIRPILTYESVIWWRVIETKSYTFMLNKFQRLCCLLITDVIKSTLQGSLDIILYIPLLPIICLKLLGELRHDIMDMVPIWERWLHFGKTFTTRITSRKEFVADSVLRIYLNIYGWFHSFSGENWCNKFGSREN